MPFFFVHAVYTSVDTQPDGYPRDTIDHEPTAVKHRENSLAIGRSSARVLPLPLICTASTKKKKKRKKETKKDTRSLIYIYDISHTR